MNPTKLIWLFAISAVLYCRAPTTLTQAIQSGEASISQAEIRTSITAIANIVNDNYFDAVVSQQVHDDLIKGLSNDEYQQAKSSSELAAIVTSRMQDLTHDKHLSVQVIKPAVDQPPAESQKQSAVDDRALSAQRSNFGIQAVEIKAGNIGYLNTTAFFRRNEAEDTIAAAMKFLSNCDAMIVDLRQNHGGSPDTVALLASYFIEKPNIKLFEIISRSGDSRFYSTVAALEHRNGARPLYILTSPETFSAGEGFAFIMQDQKRAIVIGETTPGAANPGKAYPVNKFFEVIVPNGKVVAAVNGGNWERTGVVPEIVASQFESGENDALNIAHIHALRKLISDCQEDTWREELEKQLGKF